MTVTRLQSAWRLSGNELSGKSGAVQSARCSALVSFANAAAPFSKNYFCQV
jgi:hypothetical protein